MTNKEQIIIDGVNVKDCRRRIGKNSYCRYFKRLCSENNFNCVWKQLARKTQECEELKRKVELMMDCPDCKVDEYKKALEEIEKYCNSVSVEENLYNSRHFYNGGVTVEVVNEILNIINKAKGEGK